MLARTAIGPPVPVMWYLARLPALMPCWIYPALMAITVSAWMEMGRHAIQSATQETLTVTVLMISLSVLGGLLRTAIPPVPVMWYLARLPALMPCWIYPALMAITVSAWM